jgi:DNA-binding GntR family transcriptional regulator
MPADGDDTWALAPQRSLPEMVAERVVEAMRNGTLRPGQRIVEATLAGKLGVSRGSLREALKALEADHLVESRRSHGTYVAQVTPVQAWRMVTVRAVLEGLAARLVAARCDPEVLGVLEAQHQRIRDHADAGRISEWRDQDWLFHEMVCRAADNEFLLRSWQSLGNLIRLFLHQHQAFELQAEDVLGNHEDLIAALRAGDPDAADLTFRSVILRSGMRRLGLPPPPEFASLLSDLPAALTPPPPPTIAPPPPPVSPTPHTASSPPPQTPRRRTRQRQQA